MMALATALLLCCHLAAANAFAAFRSVCPIA
jgi:hypothetical protein